MISYGLPFTALKNNKVLLCNKVGYNHPERVVVLENESGKNEHDLVWLNKETFENFELPQHERFNFTEGYNETVYGWIRKPLNYQPGKKYRTVLLVNVVQKIHGQVDGVIVGTRKCGYNRNSQLL